MKRPAFVRLAAVVAAVGVLGAATYSSFWNPTPSFDSVVDDSASRAVPTQLQAVAERRIFFGHMSVGKNILSGMEQVYASHQVAPPPTMQITPGDAPTLTSGGVLVEALIGENRHPVRKLANFETSLRAGLAEQVDIAALKFCYIDIRWNSDVEALFATYRDTLAKLEADYPKVQFVHMTVPLTTGPYGIRDHLKVMVGRNDNVARERYNALMRDTYGPDQLFDLATLEATEPDGVVRERELFGGYSSDGAHLNAAGSARIAAEFVGFLADDRS